MSLARFVAFGFVCTEFVLQGSWGEQSPGCPGVPKVLWGEASTRRPGPASCPGMLVDLVEMHADTPHEPREPLLPWWCFLSQPSRRSKVHGFGKERSSMAGEVC